jgi:CDP-paratose 2-epimerase
MKKTVLITGGAGFIGINTADHYIKKKYNVIILDNLSRKGVEKNLTWLKKIHKNEFTFIKYDLKFTSKKLEKIVDGADIIIHLAGQVAVTTSVQNPMDDFMSNALGTMNILEAARKSSKKPIVLYSSTNKVYGDLEELKILETNTRYSFKTLPKGVNEKQPLDFHSPYGCSKGASDQYVRDYARIYGLKTVVFRQSCIYGPHQYGFEDQGWVAWFIIAVLLRKNITIYGNGKQVRDLLYIDDLISAYDLAIKNIKVTSGQVYNLGGGVKNSISVWQEFGPMLQKLFNREIPVKYKKIRPGDQSIFIADTSKAKRDFGWTPKIKLTVGLRRLFTWIQDNEKEFS